jgi:hypothetical protein
MKYEEMCERWDKYTREVCMIGTTCVYDAGDGRRCAVGALLDEIDPDWEEQSPSDLEYAYDVEFPIDLDLADDLQAIHDGLAGYSDHRHAYSDRFSAWPGYKQWLAETKLADPRPHLKSYARWYLDHSEEV